MDIKTYNRKRDFRKTKEPKGKKTRPSGNTFVVQEHWASRHHFDFRLELDGVLKSWAIPKGPSLDPRDKRLAVRVEDHPVEYGSFEGEIPKGEYGAGKVIIWDAGTWECEGDPSRAYRNGDLKFTLNGTKLQGAWALVRTKMGESKNGKNWLLLKKKDAHARPGFNAAVDLPGSVLNPTDIKRPPSPQLATLSKSPQKGDSYIHEVKFDGYRTLAVVKDGKPVLFSRKGQDWTHRYPLVEKAFMGLKTNCALDGEVVYLDSEGISSFEGLQRALKNADHQKIYYYVFDVLEKEGENLKTLPQTKRKYLAEKIVREIDDDRVRYSEHFTGEGAVIFDEFCQSGLEGVISKKKNAPYTEGRNKHWQKVKCSGEDEFLIVGYTLRKNADNEIGALVLAAKKSGKLVEAGKVGSGFNREQRRELLETLSRLKRKTPPVEQEKTDSTIFWTTPKLVAQIKYTEITGSGKIRHPVFAGLREDKTPEEVRFPEADKDLSLEKLITSPDKLLFPKAGVTKLDYAKYLEEVFPYLVLHTKNRIISLLKCPNGIAKACFYNKHPGNMKGLTPVEVQRKGKLETYFTIESLEEILRLARYNGVEIHTWNSMSYSPWRPVEMIIDLDPDEGLSSKRVLDAALCVKDTLAMLDLESFPKFTGGKGVHLHVPLRPIYSTDQVYQFSKSAAYILEKDFPDLFTANSRKKERKGKIFLDYMRNSPGATHISPFSLRANEAATIALPLSWKEFKAFDLKDPPNMKRFLKGLKTYRHPWGDYQSKAQKINIFEGLAEAESFAHSEGAGPS